MIRWEYVLNRKNEFWFRTNYEAKKFKIVKSKINFRGTKTTDQSPNNIQAGVQLSDLVIEGVFSNTEKALGYFGPIIDCVPEDVKGGILESANLSAGNVLVRASGGMFLSVTLYLHLHIRNQVKHKKNTKIGFKVLFYLLNIFEFKFNLDPFIFIVKFQ